MLNVQGAVEFKAAFFTVIFTIIAFQTYDTTVLISLREIHANPPDIRIDTDRVALLNQKRTVLPGIVHFLGCFNPDSMSSSISPLGTSCYPAAAVTVLV